MSTANFQIRYQGKKKSQFNTVFAIGTFVSKEKTDFVKIPHIKRT